MRIISVALMVLTLGFLHAAQAQTSQSSAEDYDTGESSKSGESSGEACSLSSSPDVAIPACTAIIKQRPPRLGRAYNYRGWAYYRKGDYAAAIADADQAIKIRRDVGSFFALRAMALAGKGDLTSALADVNEAIRLEPDLPYSFVRRARIYRMKGDTGRALADCNEALKRDPQNLRAFRTRAGILFDKGDVDGSIAQLTEAIRIKPDYESAYFDRGSSYFKKGLMDRAIEDFSAAIRITPNSANAYAMRGVVKSQLGKANDAIADYTQTIKLNAKHAVAYSNRAWAYYELGRFAEAHADAEMAISINSSFGNAYTARGHAALKLNGQPDTALSDFMTAIRLGQEEPRSYGGRGNVYEIKGLRELAIADYRKAVELPAQTHMQQVIQQNAKERLAALTATSGNLAQNTPAPPPDGQKAQSIVPMPVNPAPEKPDKQQTATAQNENAAGAKPQTATKPAPAPNPVRVALVIGNSTYRNVSPLPNPKNDASAVADELTRLGFKVTAKYDLSVADMRQALSEFEDKAAGSDWALVYYAGHGMEMDGRNWLVPVDANLARSSDVADETIPLDRVLDRVSPAKHLRIVILDACRNNPFVSRMIMNRPGRSIGRGLAAVEPEHGEVVFYAARDGSVASDGAGKNSPFATALVKHMDEDGIELGRFFRKVTSTVLSSTNPKQEPFVYGRLPDEDFYFKIPSQ